MADNKPQSSQKQLQDRISASKTVKEIKWPGTVTGGVMPINIESRFENERHRLSEDYTKKWRQYRIKYLQSLVLKREEPLEVPQLKKLLYNPIRRFIHTPLNFYEKLVIPYIVSIADDSRTACLATVLRPPYERFDPLDSLQFTNLNDSLFLQGKHYARTTRNSIAIALIMYSAGLWVHYSISYSENANNWETYGTVTQYSARPQGKRPGCPNLPVPSKHDPLTLSLYLQSFAWR